MDLDFDKIEQLIPIYKDIDEDDSKEELIAKKIRLYELLSDNKNEEAEELLKQIINSI